MSDPVHCPKQALSLLDMTRLTRRCDACCAVVDGRVRSCAVCGAPAQRDPVRCPICLRVARFDEDGAIACPEGCFVAPANRHYIDAHLPLPKRDGMYGQPGHGECPRELPYSGWELVLRDRVKSATPSDDAVVADSWGLLGMRTDAWGDYDDPMSPSSSRMALAWGMPGDDGHEDVSIAGAVLKDTHSDSLRRIAEMMNALDDFGAEVRADATLPLPGQSARATSNHTSPLAACAGAATPQIDAASMAAADAQQDAHDIALRMFWDDVECRWTMIREVGGMLCKLLVNSIIARGGSYRGADEQLGYAELHETPFGSYRAALWFAFYTPIGNIGAGATMGSLGAAEYTHSLPSGVQAGGQMSVHATRNGSSSARNVGLHHLDHDVWRALGAARVGGTWSPDTDPMRPDAMVCAGGRPIKEWELLLLRLCDTGVEVEKGKDARRLAVTEAVDTIRKEAIENAGRARTLGHDATSWSEARHLTTDVAKRALRAARLAVTEVLIAWGLIPERPVQDRVHRERPAVDDGERPRVPLAVPRAARAHNTWDMEVPR